MSLLRQWKIMLPVLAILAIAVDMEFSSFILNKKTFHFHHGWIYLIPVFVATYALIFYFYTYKGGRMYRWISQDEPRVKHAAKIVSTGTFFAVLCSYMAFHMVIWIASYLPLFPVVDKELHILKIGQSYKGRYMVTAVDRNDKVVFMRFSRLLEYYPEGSTVNVRCVDVRFTCRILDTE